MRHDPASAAVVVMLRGLKMYGMAQAVGDLIEQGAPAFEAAVPMLSQLLKAEVAEREVRSISYQIKAARFPAYKDLAGFDFASSEVNEAMVRQLHRGEFMVGADNVVLIGGPGTGKTHIATALGVQAVEHHRKKVRFFSTVDLVNALEQEKIMNKAGQLAERLLRLDLVVLDELGYLPFSPSGGALLFHLLSKLYERTSVVITTNLSGLAPLKWRGICSVGRLSLELGGAEVVERRVAPHGVVEAVDIAGNGLPGLGAGVEDGAPDELGFDRLEERLDHGVIEAVALARHGDRDAVAA